MIQPVGTPEFDALPLWRKVASWIVSLALIFGVISLLVWLGWTGVEWWNDRDYRAALEERDCRLDDDCWGKKHHAQAELKCPPLVEQYARYRYEWTDGVTVWKFPKWSFADLDGSSGLLVYEGSQVEFQNAFGAWQRMYYSCYFDPERETAVSVSVRPY